MNEPILKIHWERFKAHVVLDHNMITNLLLPYTNAAIENLSLLSNGCANTNYKITFKNKTHPVLLRLYSREKSALSREVAIHQRIKNFIPVSNHLYTDDTCQLIPYPYAIMEWIDGKLMRDVILTNNENIIAECAFDAGKYLQTLRSIHFSESGFFEENLQIRPFSHDEEYLPYMTMLLQDKTVIKSLGSKLHQTIKQLIFEQHTLLSKENHANLTHGDYDPANVLVKQINGQWKITAVLDWEFAFASTYLFDIGTMLRYSHKLPDCYEKSFIKGIEAHGEPLPATWKKQAKLLDLLCLLQLIQHNPPKERPNANNDIVSLITHSVMQWHAF